MRVTNIKCHESPDNPGRVRMSAEIQYDDRPDKNEILWFELPKEFSDAISVSADPWLAALLPLASKIGEALHIDAAADAALLDSSGELMEWWCYWFPSMKIVPVKVNGTVRRRPDFAPSHTAQFFSGGVDSFFTLLRHTNNDDPIQIDDLLVGWGFDIPLSDHIAFENVCRSLTATAAKLGKKLVAFSTNIRDTRFGHELPWGAIGHGNAMAALALLTENAYCRVLIPSTDGYRETGPWGSHATIDHYYSSSVMRVIHDGAAFSRFQKVELVSTSAISLSALRVCWRSQADSNCGRCEKCLRTMIALDLCGALHNASTFSHAKLDLSLVARIYCPFEKKGSLQLYYLELREVAFQRGRMEIARAISKALRRSLHRRPLLHVTQKLSRVPLLGAMLGFANRKLRASLVI